MKIVNAGFEILTPINRNHILQQIEVAGRVCYKSEDKITEDSASRFVKTIVKHNHLAVIEHASITFKVICDRAVANQIVRHRVASYSQESSRYNNYSKDKFSGEITVIKPCFFEEDSKEYGYWYIACQSAEKAYLYLTKAGVKAEEARGVLPHALKTELIITMNMRELRHFLQLRTSKESHPQIREIAIPLLNVLKNELPEIFDDIGVTMEGVVK